MSTDDRVAVTTGIARLHASPGLARPGRLGPVTNHTGVLPDLRPAAPALLEVGARLVALSGPEHGLHGSGQGGESEAAHADPPTGLPVHDTHRCSGDHIDKLLLDSGVDALVYGLQDIGARFYTCVWTMFGLMASAARTGGRLAAAGRPDPLGGLVSEGPLLAPTWAGFFGRAAVSVRHGLTCGELAWYLNASVVSHVASSAVDLTVIQVVGRQRAVDAEATALPWVAPSPDIPTPATATVHPGTCPFEGRNLPEGRSTTQPFEIVGAPYIDARFAPPLAELDLPGVHLRDLWFVPAFHKHAGRLLRGVQLHVTDREVFAPVRTAVAMLNTLRRLYSDRFAWRAADSGVKGSGQRPFTDLLWVRPFTACRRRGRRPTADAARPMGRRRRAAIPLRPAAAPRDLLLLP
ncbi:exo-beta-N-acetylmuramidase NamZ family protein [Streptomyces sp. KR55]|uniref:exo-beta-N-acetylmuramidase NamZ family protein n=1 Tax=Streptomyces sp. KR55 TaxID=3457425 RepID=UPI003FD5F482